MTVSNGSHDSKAEATVGEGAPRAAVCDELAIAGTSNNLTPRVSSMTPEFPTLKRNPDKGGQTQDAESEEKMGVTSVGKVSEKLVQQLTA